MSESRLVSVKKALQICQGVKIGGNCPTCCPLLAACNMGCGSAQHEISACIEQLASRIPSWISVEERLPEKGVFVVVYYGNFIGNLMDVYMWDGECWRSSTGYLEDAENITHWMPLPEPPKEDSL